MNNSHYKELENTILSFFKANKHISLTYNEIVSALQLSKVQKAALGEILRDFQDKGLLSKKQHRFQLIPSSPLPQAETRTLSISARSAGTSKPEINELKNPRLIEGIFDATPLSRNFSYAFVRTPDKDYYISAEDTFNAYHNDVVALEVKYQRGHQDYGIIRKIVKRSSEQFAGDILKVGNRWTFVCSNPKIHNWFEVSDIGAAQEGEKVILTITNWGNQFEGKPPTGKVTEVLGKSGDPQVELLAVIRQYDLPLEFPEDVMAAANALPVELKPENYHNRRDLRELFTFTIDPVSAKDFDDAISLGKTPKGWKLYVHIADVADYLPVEGALFQEASKRGNSFYFPKKVIPMLPERISNLICSLRPQEEKLCLTVETEFTFKGAILAQHIYESVICSNFRLAYEEVDVLFEGGSSDLDAKLKETLLEARTLSRMLTDKRNAAGYIFFDLLEIEFEYDENGFVKRLNLAEETESHKLIENFMLVANEFVAMRLSQVSPMSIYRIHEDPDFNKLQKLIDLLSNYGVKWVMHENLNKSLQYLLASFPKPEYHEVFDRITLRSMKKAKYSTEHISHFGLALKDYTHFTSPIRRLCDLVIHHLCKTYLIKSQAQKFSQVQMQHYAETASERELLADQAERDIDRVYSRAFMREKIGETFNGMVISTSGTGVVVKLKEMPVTGIIKVADLGEGQWSHFDREMRYVNKRSGLFYQLMDTLQVEIISIEDDIYLRPVKGAESLKHVYTPQLASKNNPRNKGVDFKSRHQKPAHGYAKPVAKRGRKR